jgi:hypothetical protein
MTSIGTFRYESHLRELAGLAPLMGVTQPLSDVTVFFASSHVSQIKLIGKGETPNDGTLLWIIVGGLSLIAVGVVSVFVSYHTLVHNGHTDHFMKNLLVALLVGVQTGYVLYFTYMVYWGKNAREDVSNNYFIPLEYDPSESDVKVMASMAILSVMTYAFTLVGSLAFFFFAMHAFINGTPELRPATYLRGPMLFYCFVLALAGFTQLLMGSYVHKNFADDSGDLPYGPIVVPFCVVMFPAINIVIGGLQLLFGLWGVLRSLHVSIFVIGADHHETQSYYDKTFQIAMFSSWFLQLVLQFIAQIGYPGTDFSSTAPTFLPLALGLNLMPAYLDYEMRSSPEVIDKVEYYGFRPDAATERLEQAPKNLHDDDDVESPAAKQRSDEGL